MRCDAIERMVNRYIDHSLTLEELEGFLNHIEGCSSCYEELETYFIVHAAMDQLDSDSSELAFDLRQLLKQDIKKQRAYVRKKKIWKFVKRAGKILLMGCVLLLLVFYLCKAGIITWK